MGDELITVENVGKKFCLSLKRSLWYGFRDIAAELVSQSAKTKELRTGEFWAVKDVSFSVKRGETIGLIGRNGAGKTTLLRMLNGLIKPDRGEIHIRGRMQALIALGAGFNPILTGRENIYVNASVLGVPKKEIDEKLEEIIAFSGIGEFMDTPVQSYSSGMAVRLGFSVAAHLDPDILLVDEVLAVGDEGFQSKCLNKIGELKKRGAAIILISHNMHTVLTFANKVALLNNGQQEIFTDVHQGIKAYRNLFLDKEDLDIQKVINGNDKINFLKVEISKRKFHPGESFSIILQYESEIDYLNAEIDIGIYSAREPFFHFQATNKAYNKTINFYKGRHALEITILDIRINHAMAKVLITIWTNNRTEQLFWWRIPVEFDGANHSSGNSFLNVIFKQ